MGGNSIHSHQGGGGGIHQHRHIHHSSHNPNHRPDGSTMLPHSPAATAGSLAPGQGSASHPACNTVFIGSSGCTQQYEAMLAHLNLCDEIALMLRAADGAVVGCRVSSQGKARALEDGHPIMGRLSLADDQMSLKMSFGRTCSLRLQSHSSISICRSLCLP